MFKDKSESASNSVVESVDMCVSKSVVVGVGMNTGISTDSAVITGVGVRVGVYVSASTFTDMRFKSALKACIKHDYCYEHRYVDKNECASSMKE